MLFPVNHLTGLDENEEERLVYEVRMQSLADVESKIASAEEEGKAEGINETTKNIALNLIRESAAVEIIAKVTGFARGCYQQLAKSE